MAAILQQVVLIHMELKNHTTMDAISMIIPTEALLKEVVIAVDFRLAVIDMEEVVEDMVAIVVVLVEAVEVMLVTVLLVAALLEIEADAEDMEETVVPIVMETEVAVTSAAAGMEGIVEVTVEDEVGVMVVQHLAGYFGHSMINAA